MKQTFFEKLKRKIIYWLARRLPDCKTITPKLGVSRDDKLSRREQFITSLHLLTCEACALYAEQIEFIREVLEKQEKYFQNADVLPELSVEARRRIKSALRSWVNPAIN